MGEPQDKREVIALIGGGRWARVYLSVMADMDLPMGIAVVSRSSADDLARLQAAKGLDMAVVSTVEELLERYEPRYGIVVNAARLHAATTLRLVESGISVLVEKPLALTAADAERIYAASVRAGVHVAPGLTFQHCSYIERFARIVWEAGSPVVRGHLAWCDPVAEIRYGEGKTYDPGTSVAQDVMPHVWSILASTLGPPPSPAEVRDCVAERGGRCAIFSLCYGQVPVRVSLEREGTARQRLLSLDLLSGDRLSIDFTSEPGTIYAGSKTLCGDPDWAVTEKPVLRQLKVFFAQAGKRAVDASAHWAGSGTVALVETADRFLKQQQLSCLLQGMPRPEDDLLYAIRELACPRLYQKNLIQPGDRAALNRWTSEIMAQSRAISQIKEWRSLLDLGDSSADKT